MVYVVLGQYDSIKGQIRVLYTNYYSTSRFTFARNVEVLLVFFKYLFPYQSEGFVHISPRISICFQFDFSVKSSKFSTRNSKYFVYILQQLLSMRRAHVGNPTCYLPLANQRPESIRFLQSHAHP